jgi:16S rRNA (guanine527-N7)-methyltransferase
MSLENRLKELLLDIEVEIDSSVCGGLVWYLEEMLRWNRSINLTAINNPEEALEKHLIDSLTLVALLQGDEQLLDMGSGAGLPGIPVKIVMPSLRILSVDSAHKKIVFQQHVARSLRLQGFEARSCRIQVLAANPDYVQYFDVVTARALTHLSQLLEMAQPFLTRGGRLVAMKGPEGVKELGEAAVAMEKCGFVVDRVRHLQLPISGAERTLIVLKQQILE